MTPFRSLATAMAKGFVRDRMALFFSVLFPMMFLVLFGGIFSDQGAPRLTITVVGDVQLLDRLPADTRAGLEAAVDLVPADDVGAALALLRAGDSDAVLSQDGDRLELRYSEADPVTAGTVQGTIRGVVQQANLEAAGSPPRYTLSAAQVEDESLETIQYVTPGLLGWAIATSAAFGASANLVGWRRSGLLRRLRLAPVSTPEVVVSRVVVSVGIALLQAVLFVGLAWAVFGLRLTGAWPMALPLLVCGTLAFMAIGLLAGSVSRTEEGATGLANFVILPMAFLSGSFIPLDAAPGWLRTVSVVLPLRHLNDGMLDVMVRGQGPVAAVGPMLILVGFAAVLTLVAVRLFRWEPD